MANIINWIITNLGDICTIICAFIFFCSLIVKLTPSTKDNEILSKIIGFLDKFSIAKTADDKKCIQEAKENSK